MFENIRSSKKSENTKNMTLFLNGGLVKIIVKYFLYIILFEYALLKFTLSTFKLFKKYFSYFNSI